jgi:hypothetical protein
MTDITCTEPTTEGFAHIPEQAGRWLVALAAVADEAGDDPEACVAATRLVRLSRDSLAVGERAAAER